MESVTLLFAQIELLIFTQVVRCDRISKIIQIGVVRCGNC